MKGGIQMTIAIEVAKVQGTKLSGKLDNIKSGIPKLGVLLDNTLMYAKKIKQTLRK